MSGVQFEIRVITNNGASEIKEVKTEINQTAEATNNLNDKFKRVGDAVFTFNNISTAIGNVVDEFNKAIQPGIDFNSSLKDMQAITGVSDDVLNKIGDTARQTAKDFGIDAAQGVETYKLLLSQLSPELAKAPDALNAMGQDAAILSKQLSGDTTAATEVLTTALNQYGISMDDPIKATQVMTDMMNIMSAAAKEGSAELPQIKSALEQAGMMAKTANVPFNELNAAIQVLDKAGKKGAEGGVAIRNVLAEISQGQFMPKQTLAMLQAAGIDVEKLSDKSLSFADRLNALNPIVNNTAAMTQLFGKENVASAIALVQNSGEISNLTTKITGTNTATQMADTIMGSFSERMARVNSWFKDLGISIFNATDGFIPFVQIGMGALQTMSNLGGAVQAFTIISNLGFVKSIIAGATSMGTWIATTISATAAQWGLNIAMDANPIGILVLAIGAAITAIALIINYWDEITDAIISFGKWIWEHSPFKFLIDVVDNVFPGFKKAMSDLWDWVKGLFEKLFAWIKQAWDWIKKIFGGGDSPTLEVNESAVKDFGSQVQQNMKIEGINVQATVDDKSVLDGYNPHKKKGKGNNVTVTDTADRITSAGARPTTINLHIQKLQDQTVIHTTNIDMAGKQAGEKIIEYIMMALNSVNGSFQNA